MNTRWILIGLENLALTSNRLWTWLGASLFLMGMIFAMSTFFLPGGSLLQRRRVRSESRYPRDETRVLVRP